MDELDIRYVSTYLLKGKKRDNPKTLYRIYELAFKTWHDTWEKTYQNDFHSEKRLNSDTFTRQDDVLALFYQGQCFAVCIFTHLNMEEEHAHLDSYFNCWPSSAIEQLCAKGPNIVACTQYTVHEDFRVDRQSPLGKNRWRILINGMIARYFLSSGKDAMSAITRVAKGIDKVSYRNGGVQLAAGLFYEAGADKAKVDLVAFYKEEGYETYVKNPYAHYFDELWEMRNGAPIRLAA
jgi:hypothetical protein